MENKLLGMILISVLLLLILAIVIRNIRRRKDGYLFSPLNFISLYYSYYIIVPYFFSEGNIYKEISGDTGAPYLIGGCIVSMVFILLGFHSKFHIGRFHRLNHLYTPENSAFLCIGFVLIAFCSYAIFNGFTFNVIQVQNEVYDAGANIFNHEETYVTNLVCLYPAAACLAYSSYKRKWFSAIVFVVAILSALMGGARWRFILLLVPFFIFIHAYPNIKKINWKLWIPIGLVFYFAMGIIEQTRNYNSGLDLNKLTSLNEKELTQGASENEMVYYFSAKVMDVYSDKEPLYFESLFTALTMPLPRALFPWKPDAQYLRDANIQVLGTVSHGAAYLNIVEGYLSFGWLGIALNGFFLGLISKQFWRNYLLNKTSIGAILFLGLFNALLYVLISRGYLAQELICFIYYIPVVYWVSVILLKVCHKKTLQK